MFKDYVLYNFVSNAIEVVCMISTHDIGDYVKSYCGYTGKEIHRMFLGEL